MTFELPDEQGLLGIDGETVAFVQRNVHIATLKHAIRVFLPSAASFEDRNNRLRVGRRGFA